MNKYKILLIIILFLLAISTSFLIFYNLGGKNPINIGNSIKIEILPKDNEYNRLIRSEISLGNKGKVDTKGIRNHVSSDFNELSPLIEFRSFIREKDGNLYPFNIALLNIMSQEPLSGAAYGVDANGLRVGLNNQLDGMLYLLYDVEYAVVGTYHKPGDPNNIFRGKTEELKFRTPKKLEPGELCRVDLILIDMLK